LWTLLYIFIHIFGGLPPIILCEIWGFYGGDYEGYCFVGALRCVLSYKFTKCATTIFRVDKQFKQASAMHSSETSVNFCQVTQLNTPRYCSV
jgi:hypothetical protein